MLFIRPVVDYYRATTVFNISDIPLCQQCFLKVMKRLQQLQTSGPHTDASQLHPTADLSSGLLLRRQENLSPKPHIKCQLIFHLPELDTMPNPGPVRISITNHDPVPGAGHVATSITREEGGMAVGWPADKHCSKYWECANCLPKVTMVTKQSKKRRLFPHTL